MKTHNVEITRAAESERETRLDLGVGLIELLSFILGAICIIMIVGYGILVMQMVIANALFVVDVGIV